MLAGLRKALKELVQRRRERRRQQIGELVRQRPRGREIWAKVDAAIEKAVLSARDHGRTTLCADEVLLSILDQPEVAQYLQSKKIVSAELRADLEKTVALWPTAAQWPSMRASAADRPVGGSKDLQMALQWAIMQRGLHNPREATLLELLEALLWNRRKRAEVRGRLENLGRADSLGRAVALMHWYGRCPARLIAEELGIAEEAVRQEIERTRQLHFPNAASWMDGS